ncbi:phosphatidate cytidylyltransferase [Oryzomicrobium terrae]|uniref:Phosphatidate cytidylyltransferase n=1 Tax=Oryzomicrobium terrae TaxID=1735038 RepID=A0A5C1E828_9RHOO|nr:phosphatidate cytidylyltransferase [Oryzomicrobium terrae]QEL65023.1 phosphatidate cytidylyltransferase [Oryzomicrobium terrae]
MLKTRVITAVILLLVFLGAIFLLPRSIWALFCGVVAVLAAWEWGGFLGLASRSRVFLAGAVGLLLLALTLALPGMLGISDGFVLQGWAFGRFLLVPSVLFWAVAVPLWLRYRWPLKSLPLGLLVGAVVILPTWLALVQLRALGPWPLLAIMAVVWMADIAAYFSGRAFGKHKLAPNISPGKTWEGALGAGVGVIAYGWILRTTFPDYLDIAPLTLALGLVLVTAVSVIGDLFESLLKRQAGIKDSSQLLPGHGGVLDRIDSLTSTLPLVTLLWLVFQR